MEAVSGIVALTALAWNYCSLSCYSRVITATLEELQRKIMECPRCSGIHTNLSNAVGQPEATPERTQQLDPLPDISSSAENESVCATEICQGPNCKHACCRPGKITINPFFNFVRTMRPSHCGQKQSELVQEAARIWNKMTHEQKCQYTMRAVRIKRQGWKSQEPSNLIENSKLIKHLPFSTIKI